MSTATPAKAKKPIPPLTDVRIVGGKTTIKLRAPGKSAIERFDALLQELGENAIHCPEVKECRNATRLQLAKLCNAIGYKPPTTEAGDEEAE